MFHFHGCLVAFVGDTPASALIGGFKEGVGGAYRGCRSCMIETEDLSTTVSLFLTLTKVHHCCSSSVLGCI